MANLVIYWQEWYNNMWRSACLARVKNTVYNILYGVQVDSLAFVENLEIFWISVYATRSLSKSLQCRYALSMFMHVARP